MDSAEIGHALDRARAVPEGRDRTGCLEALASAARVGDDRRAESEVLLALVQAYTYAGERDLAPIVIVRLLRVFDDHAEATAGLSGSVHWYMKWMTSDLIDNPAVPLGAILRWFDELESRYRTAGYSLLANLERLAETASSPEVRGELLRTRRQLDTMRTEASSV